MNNGQSSGGGGGGGQEAHPDMVIGVDFGMTQTGWPNQFASGCCC